MRLQLRLKRRPFALTTLATTALLAAGPVSAQNNNNNNNDEPASAADEDTAAAADPTTADDAAATTAAADTNTAEPAETTAEPATTADDAETTEAATTEDPTSTAEPAETTTEEPTTEATETEPTTTEEAETTMTEAATSTGSDGALLTDAPSLTRGFGIPTYPAASVPPTYNAPFMQHSRAPDGTIFIAVGAILGAFGLGILLWRVIVSLLLHRSVERAAMAQHDATSKAGFPAPPAPFYKYTDQGSNKSLSGTGAAATPAAGRGVRRTNRGVTPSSNPSQSNLFFSPTAAASGNAGNRGSSYLPSGFYAAGSGAGANQGQSISLTNLRPDSRGQPAATRITPPDSPAFPARRDMSTSSLNLARPSSQRAPSAYLDDLLADDPSAFPPPNMPPQSGPQRNSLGPGSNRI